MEWIGGAQEARIAGAGHLLIVMLSVTGGRERTPGDYAALFERSGWFELAHVTPTMGAVHLVEARPKPAA